MKQMHSKPTRGQFFLIDDLPFCGCPRGYTVYLLVAVKFLSSSSLMKFNSLLRATIMTVISGIFAFRSSNIHCNPVLSTASITFILGSGLIHIIYRPWWTQVPRSVYMPLTTFILLEETCSKDMAHPSVVRIWNMVHAGLIREPVQSDSTLSSSDNAWQH